MRPPKKGLANVMRMPGGSRGGDAALAQTGQPLAIVAAVIIIGASIYLWYLGYMRSRAALLTLALVIGVLVYFGFFYGYPPT